MKNIILVFLFWTIPLFSFSQEVKVLFIGNSFTYYNQMPTIFEDIGNDAGKNIYTEMHAPGGCSVGDTLPISSPLAHMDNPIVYNLIKSNNWDYVIIQDNQGRFVYDYGVFNPDTRVIEGHKMLTDSVKYYNPCAKMIWFAGWGPKTGAPPYGNTGIETIERIWANYTFMNDSLKEIIAPIAPAWIKCVEEQSNIDLWSLDQTHPSVSGSFLTALNFYYTIFKEKIPQLNYTAGLSFQDAEYFNNLAFDMVKDSVVITNLISTTPQISQIGNVLSVVDTFETYQWYLDGTAISLETAFQINISTNGAYYVVVSDESFCEHSSFISDVTLSHIGDANYSNISVFPNPSNGQFVIEGACIQEIKIIDITGKIVFQTVIANKVKQSINLSSNLKGIYFAKITTSEGIKIEKLIVR